jgi:hypothetical protein
MERVFIAHKAAMSEETLSNSLDKEDWLVLRISAVRLERALIMRPQELPWNEKLEQWNS